MTFVSTQSPEERFWVKVKKAAPDECWEWTAHCDREGYGKFRSGDYQMNAHRFIYLAVKGELPAGWTVDHLCRNRACVNPAHLEGVPERVNILRGIGTGALYAKRTHCKHGHEFTPENTGHCGRARVCLECRRISNARLTWATMNDAQREKARVYSLASYHRRKKSA